MRSRRCREWVKYLCRRVKLGITRTPILNEILAERVEPRFVMPFLAKRLIERFVKHVATQLLNIFIGVLLHSPE
jgi:hypothetical protein